jgi:hypothetical protein
MIASASRARLFGVWRRRRAQAKRTLADWVALTIARGLSLAVVGGLVYLTYVIEMAGYNDFLRCNPKSTLTRFEWVLGSRPAEDCRR